MTTRKLTLRSIGADLRAAIEAAQEKKASDLVVLDLRGLATFSDFFFIATGNSKRQLKTIAEAIEEVLAKKGVKPDHVEGYLHGDWVLMDYVDFIVHVFTPPSREYYNLERLWGDAERLAIAS